VITQHLRGKVTDMGGVIVQEVWHVKGRTSPHIRWRLGVAFDTTAADRVVSGVASPSTGMRDLTMDLQADKQVPLSVQFTDEVGNPAEAPADAVVTYTVDDPSIINLTDNGDGTAVAAAVGALGAATVHVEATANGETVTGDLAIVVVAGLAERISVVAGEPTEVTPDEAEEA
jgi:hypothetical protein